MLILAIETTGDLCSLAIRNEQGTLVERVFRHRMRLSERLIGDVDALLTDAETSLDAVEGLAVGLGPGSFTGVRLGVMTVKTWADLLQKPVVGISALDALALENGAGAECIVPLIRARPGAVYAGFYRWRNGDRLAQGEAKMMTVAELVEGIKALDAPSILICGDGLPKVGAELAPQLRGTGLDLLFGPTDAPRAGTLARLAETRFAAGQSDDPLELAPLYVAPPPIDPRVEARIAAQLRKE